MDARTRQGSGKGPRRFLQGLGRPPRLFRQTLQVCRPPTVRSRRDRAGTSGDFRTVWGRSDSRARHSPYSQRSRDLEPVLRTRSVGPPPPRPLSEYFGGSVDRPPPEIQVPSRGGSNHPQVEGVRSGDLTRPIETER